jgi:hypothetical protein
MFGNPSWVAFSENARYFLFACDSPAYAAIASSCVAMDMDLVRGYHEGIQRDT